MHPLRYQPGCNFVVRENGQSHGTGTAHTAPGDEDTSPATRPPLIYWRNKPASRRCRLTMRARGAVRSVSYSKCGRKLARAEGRQVVVCDAETGFVEWVLEGHGGTVHSVAWNHDGTKLASGSLDNTVKIWSKGSSGNFECKSTLTGHTGYVPAPPCSAHFQSRFVCSLSSDAQHGLERRV